MSNICGNCAAPLETGTKFCGTCGAVVEPAPKSPAVTTASRPMASPNRGRRYPALRVIAVVLKVLAVLGAIGGAITGLSTASLTSSMPSGPFGSPGIGAAGTAMGWIIFFAGLGYGLFLWASAEMIHVLVDIEENTRRSAFAA